MLELFDLSGLLMMIFVDRRLFQGQPLLHLGANCARSTPACIPKPVHLHLPCEGAGACTSCTNLRSQSLFDFFIRNAGSCLSVDECNDPTSVADLLAPATVGASANAITVVANPVAIGDSAAIVTAPASGQMRITPVLFGLILSILMFAAALSWTCFWPEGAEISNPHQSVS
jgi:hypothetical protein